MIAKYSAYVLQRTVSPSMIRGELCVSALWGAGDPPSPDKYVVIPWRSLLSALGGSVISTRLD